MSFMTATINLNKEVFVLHERQNEGGPEFITETRLPNDLPEGVYDIDDLEDGLDLDEDDRDAIMRYLEENCIEEFEVTKPLYWGELSAAGYMDKTSVELGETYAEVAQQLLDLYYLYYDHDEVYMDEDEKRDMRWLEQIASGVDPREATGEETEEVKQ